MIKYLSIIILLVLAIACATKNSEYFPKGIFAPAGTSHDNILIKSYSLTFSDIHEPSLWEILKNKQKIESYRFLFSRPFQDNVCIRIEIKNPDEIAIYTKIFRVDPNSKEYQIELTTNSKRNISATEIKSLLKQIDNIDFWELKSENFPGDMVSDASTFFFEGVKNDKYQAVKIPLVYDTLREQIIQLADLFLDLVDL